MKKYITLLSFITIAFACNKSEELSINEIAFEDAIELTELTTSLSEPILTQTATEFQSMESDGAKWTKEEIRTFTKNWMALSREEKKEKFPTLTKREKRILFVFMSVNKKKRKG